MVDLQEAISFQQDMIRQGSRHYESFLRKLIATCLNKDESEVVPESDAPRFSFVYSELAPGRKFIGFDGNLIGEEVFSVETDLENGIAKAIWQFVPKTKID